jgi:hypothetical protein
MTLAALIERVEAVLQPFADAACVRMREAKRQPDLFARQPTEIEASDLFRDAAPGIAQ